MEHAIRPDRRDQPAHRRGVGEVGDEQVHLFAGGLSVDCGAEGGEVHRVAARREHIQLAGLLKILEVIHPAAPAVGAEHLDGV